MEDSTRATDLQEVLNAMSEERNERAARARGHRDAAEAAKAQIGSFLDAAAEAAAAEDDKRVAELDRQMFEMRENIRSHI